MKHHIHIFGASGSGTTSIAKAASGELSYLHFDSDDYFWLPTENPFTVERSEDERVGMMRKDLSGNTDWVLSGSVVGWADILIPYFDLVVFVYVHQDLRIERLKKRERERYGDAILPGGNQYEKTQAFLDWAAKYDSGTRNGRSLIKHEALLKNIKCPVVKIVNNNLQESIRIVVESICE